MEKRHIPSPGEPFITTRHIAAENCPCAPDRATVYKSNATGRGGRHQGRTAIRIDYRHRPLT